MRKMTAAAVLAATLATGAGAALTAPGLALAASDTGTSSSTTATDRAAARLTAIKDALKSLVSDGTITQTQADKVATTLSQADLGGPGGPGGHGGGPGGALSPTAVASVLGVTHQQLDDARAQGQTLAQVAQGKGISRADLISKLKAAATTQLDADLKAGRITQAQRDQRVAGLDAELGALVDSTRPGPGGRDGDGSHGPGGTSTTPAPSGNAATPTPTA